MIDLIALVISIWLDSALDVPVAFRTPTCGMQFKTESELGQHRKQDHKLTTKDVIL